jgi:hypothetical protein
MKTSVEISGYIITIEETDGIISVNASKEDEIVEEFTINVEESEEGFGEEGEEFGEEGEVKSFGDYDEEEDFDSESQAAPDDFEDDLEGDDDDEEDDDDDDEEDNRALESFQSYINKKK